MAIKSIVVCDCCGKEISLNSQRYHIDFTSSKFCDAAGASDYNSVRVDLCEACCKKAVSSLHTIASVKEAGNG